jgi:predicted TIM-barrel fold metal-dependent hydrolase
MEIADIPTPEAMIGRKGLKICAVVSMSSFPSTPRTRRYGRARNDFCTCAVYRDRDNVYSALMIIDAHTHAFPDAVAERAIPWLEEEGKIKAYLDGTIRGLLESMDRAGIDAAVVASIATKPSQFDSILRWSQSIANERIIPFPSVHPADDKCVDQVSEIRKAGFRGVKLHPYYQKFSLEEERIRRLLERIEREGLVLLIHAGFDLAYERFRVADPRMIAETLELLPGLKLIASHFGSWEDWDEFERHLLGREVYIDTSFSVTYMGADRARRLINAHPEEYILFGSDSPWGSQPADLSEIESFNLDDRKTQKILGANARRLLGID